MRDEKRARRTRSVLVVDRRQVRLPSSHLSKGTEPFHPVGRSSAARRTTLSAELALCGDCESAPYVFGAGKPTVTGTPVYPTVRGVFSSV